MEAADHALVTGSAWTAVLLHPHPSMGGDRFNHVVDALYHALPRSGFSAVRFDFESPDVAVAAALTVDALDLVVEGRPVLIGYSFGADVAASVTDPRLGGWLLIAPPLQLTDHSAVAVDPRPKWLVVAEHDQFCPPERVRRVTVDWVNTNLTTIAAADHLLVGRAAAVVELAQQCLRGLGARPAGDGG